MLEEKYSRLKYWIISISLLIMIIKKGKNEIQ